MVHGENRIPYWIDRRLTGLAGPEYHAIISFGLPIEPEDSQYGKSPLSTNLPNCASVHRGPIQSRHSVHVSEVDQSLRRQSEGIIGL